MRSFRIHSAGRWIALILAVSLGSTGAALAQQKAHPKKAALADHGSWPTTAPGEVRLKDFRPFRAVYDREYTQGSGPGAGEKRQDRVIVHAEEVGWDWLHAGDVALNLRGPSSGGTSGGIFQAFSFGRPVIASDAAEQRELPDSCVLKVPLGEGEVEGLARTLVELRNDPQRVEGLERAVRTFVEEECHWGIVARKYAENLEEFPVPRVSRKRLFSLRLDLQKNRAAR